MHTITFWISFILLASLSLATICEWNDPNVIERKNIIIKTFGHRRIRIYNSTISVFLSENNPRCIPSPRYESHSYWVNNIRFRGNAVQGMNDVYYDMYLSKLKSFYTHYIKGFRCRVTFVERTASTITDKVLEEAIVSIAQSCIEMMVCPYTKQGELDRDANIYYQSIQSIFNELADVIATILLQKTVTNEYHSVEFGMTKPINIKGYDIIECRLHGLQTLQRLKDVIIKKTENSLTFNLLYRFSFLLFRGNAIISKDLGWKAKTTLIISGPVFAIEGRLDYTDQSCTGKILKIKIDRIESVLYSLPVYEVPNNMPVDDFRNAVQPEINNFFEKLTVDCQEYVYTIATNI